jgi:peptide deformylase
MDRILNYRTDKKALLTPGVEVTAEMVKSTSFKKNLTFLEKLLQEDGVGLAATQIGWSVRLFILSIDGNGEPTKTKVFLNPKILTFSKKKVKMEEGCLSFPGLFLKIKRPESIVWEYETIDGKKVEEEARGLYARAIQHEVGHCDGEVFVKYATSVQNLKVKKWL